jgi:hypothetical protein
MATTNSKGVEDFKNSMSLLKSFLDSYEKGDSLIYLPMAVELRKLLCEKQDSPLIERVIPGIELYKLHSTELFANNPNLLEGLQNFMPGRIALSPGKLPTFDLLISKQSERMKVELWVNQMFFKEGITVRELIKSVADKLAAHADKNYNDTLIHCRNWTFNDVECQILGIYGISKFIYDFVNLEYPEYILI